MTTKRYVVKRVRHYMNLLHLEHALLGIMFSPTPVTTNGRDIAASLSSHYPYETATLRIYPVLLTMTKAEVDLTIIHELIHLVTAPMAYLIDNPRIGKRNPEMGFVAIEQTTDKLAIIIKSLIELKK